MIPNFQSLMRPILEEASASTSIPIRDLIGGLAARFQLTAAERLELLASGRQAIFDRRAGVEVASAPVVRIDLRALEPR